MSEADEEESVPVAERRSVELDGCDLHVSVVVDADDELGRERLQGTLR